MNRKSKAIIDAAVAMGYGTAADYSGGSVADVLGQFAAIAQEQGGGGSGGGGGAFVVSGTMEGTTMTLDKTAGEIAAAARTQYVVLIMGDDTQFYIMPMLMYQKTSQGNIIVSFSSFEFSAANDSAYPSKSLG